MSQDPKSKAYLIGKILRGAAIEAGKAAKAGAKLTGDALHEAASFVHEHRDEIASGTRKVVAGTGVIIKGTGEVIKSGAAQASTALHGAAGKNSNNLAKGALHAGGFLSDAAGAIGKATSVAGKVTQNSAPYVGGVTGNAISSTVGSFSNVVDTVAITEADFTRLRNRLGRASVVLQQRSVTLDRNIKTAQRLGHKKELLDLLMVGGMTLSYWLKHPGEVPAEVEKAFELAYPDMAAHGETFAHEIASLPTANITGVLNAVKGKLFEIKLVDHLNADGNLPAGLHAELAHSANQPGYDILITGPDHQIVDLVQAKATESASYVQQALHHYPDINVTTTTEVYGHLVALGAVGRIHDSGISDQALQAKVEAALDAAGSHHFTVGDLAPSYAGLAIIALSTFMDKSESLEKRAKEFGTRTGRATVSSGFGKGVLLATNTWWLGLVVGIGSRVLITKGGDKRERIEALKAAVEMAERKLRPSIEANSVRPRTT